MPTTVHLSSTYNHAVTVPEGSSPHNDSRLPCWLSLSCHRLPDDLTGLNFIQQSTSAPRRRCTRLRCLRCNSSFVQTLSDLALRNTSRMNTWTRRVHIRSTTVVDACHGGTRRTGGLHKSIDIGKATSLRIHRAGVRVQTCVTELTDFLPTYLQRSAAGGAGGRSIPSTMRIRITRSCSKLTTVGSNARNGGVGLAAPPIYQVEHRQVPEVFSIPAPSQACSFRSDALKPAPS